MRTDENGLERGMLIAGPLSALDEEQGKTRLLCVTQVRSLTSVTAIAHFGDMSAEYQLRTHNMKARPEWKLLRWDEKAGELVEIEWP